MPRRKTRARNTSTLLKELARSRSFFSRSSGRGKLALLKQLHDREFDKADLLKQYHDLLCFFRAFPDNASVKRETEDPLRSFGERVAQYKERSRDRSGRKLYNSGIVDTLATHPFSLGAIEMLYRWHGDKLSIDWDTLDEDVADNLMAALPLLTSWQETDVYDNDPDVDWMSWLAIARDRAENDLTTVIKLFTRSELPPQVQRQIYDDLNLAVDWDLADSPASRTLARLPAGRVYYQKGPLKGRTRDLRAELRKPPKPLRLLPVREGKRYVRAINEVLAVRTRELFPITFANPAEVYCYEPGRGLQIFVFGTYPDIRLPLESNFGAMLVRNGVPIGYGISATLFDRVEIAINVFPAFRSGESSFIIEQFFRIFYHHFGSRVLVVRSRQMGDGDTEPLYAGSFWFYYKLGFRAVKPRVRNLAEEECQNIVKRRGYRSPMKMLRRLSKSDVFFHIDPVQMDSWREMSVINLGYLITKYAAERFNGDRHRMVERSCDEVARALKVKGIQKWPHDEQVAFERLAPLMAKVPDLSDWSEREKSALVRVMRAKGARREKKFVELSNRHTRLKAALEDLASAKPE